MLFRSTRDHDKSGLLFSGGLRDTWHVFKGVAIGEESRLLYDTGVFKSSRGFMGSVQASIDIAVGPHTTVSPLIFRYSQPFGLHDDRKMQTVIGFGMSRRLR